MRFVILEHRRLNCVHWDLLLDAPWAPLRSWALEHFPPGKGWQQAWARPPHRRVYLSYQGPIMGSRGFVRRIEAGTYRLLTDEPTAVRLLLTGRQLRGLFELECAGTSAACWRYRFQLALGA